MPSDALLDSSSQMEPKSWRLKGSSGFVHDIRKGIVREGSG